MCPIPQRPWRRPKGSWPNPRLPFQTTPAATGCWDVEILTKRAPQGIAECERALELDRNLATAPMPLSDLAKFSSVAPKRQIVGLAPRPERYQCPYMEEFCRPCEDASRQVMTAQSRGFDERSKSAEIIWSHTLNLAAARAQLGRLDEARSSAKAGLAVNPTFTVSRTHSAWTAMSDDTTYLAQVERRLLGGQRKAGLPKG